MAVSRPSLGRLILVPALITLAVTLVRLAGELSRWSPSLFNREPGGPGALVGIVWLIPVFGIYFALRLARAGEKPTGVGRTLACDGTPSCYCRFPVSGHDVGPAGRIG